MGCFVKATWAKEETAWPLMDVRCRPNAATIPENAVGCFAKTTGARTKIGRPVAPKRCKRHPPYHTVGQDQSEKACSRTHLQRRQKLDQYHLYLVGFTTICRQVRLATCDRSICDLSRSSAACGHGGWGIILARALTHNIHFTDVGLSYPP